eukprot:gene18660-biopygen23435
MCCVDLLDVNRDVLQPWGAGRAVPRWSRRTARRRETSPPAPAAAPTAAPAGLGVL